MMVHTPPGVIPEPGPAYLESTYYLDWKTESVRRFAEKTVAGEQSDIGRAVKLFYAVRDDWRYDPFAIRLIPETYVASYVLTAKSAYCIQKANLLAALARAVGICAAIGLSDVVNHLTTEKLRKRMGGTNLFRYHGYTVLYLDGKWVKAAPAFNLGLCQRFGVVPTEFDGHSDAIFQEFDASNRRHMEYVEDHGMWSDFPYELVDKDFRAYYPKEVWSEAPEEEKFEDGVLIR
ncbi:MAG: transglutaminase family protein [Betaproteobacteria bacterium]|nr:transglutaminase family protein [Betaproteobacteria bacterium]